MNKFKTVSGLLLIAAIAGCSSSSTNSGGGGTTTTGGTVALPVAPGAGTGAISASTLSGVSAALDELTTAINAGTIAAPTTAPTGTATMNGYVSIDGGNATESVVGNLTVNADFDAGTVTSAASDFGEFDFTDPNNPVAVSTIGITGGSLSGTGTINSTTISSTLDGNITTQAGNVTIDSDMNGDVLDNGGVLLLVGDVTGTATDATGTSALEGGAFVATE